MASRNEFRSWVVPFVGKYCLLTVVSEGLSATLLIRLVAFSDEGMMSFSRFPEDDVQLDLGNVREFDIGSAFWAPPEVLKKFERYFQAGASARIDGRLRVTILFGDFVVDTGSAPR